MRGVKSDFPEKNISTQQGKALVVDSLELERERGLVRKKDGRVVKGRRIQLVCGTMETNATTVTNAKRLIATSKTSGSS